MNIAINLLLSYAPLSVANQKRLVNLIDKQVVKPNHVEVIGSGIAAKMFFAQEGSFIVSKKKKSHVKNYIIHANQTSFIHFEAYHNKDVEVTLTALDECTLYSIPYSAIEILAFEYPQINKLYTEMRCLDGQIYSSDFKHLTQDVEEKPEPTTWVKLAQSLSKIAGHFF